MRGVQTAARRPSLDGAESAPFKEARQSIFMPMKISRVFLAAVCAIGLARGSVRAADSTAADCWMVKILKGKPGSPYRLHPAIDIPMVGGTVSLLFLSTLVEPRWKHYDSTDLATFDRNDVNVFDRWAIGRRDTLCQTLSDASNALVSNWIWFALLGKQSRQDALKILAMYTELGLMYPLTILYSHPLAARKRPYVYEESEATKARLDYMSQRSFLSGHTAWAFSAAVFTGCVFRTYYPESPMKVVVWGLCLGNAVTTGALRVIGHWHYPTDVIAGAAVGSLMGWFVQFAHRRGENRRVSVLPYVGERSGVLVTIDLPQG